MSETFGQKRLQATDNEQAAVLAWEPTVLRDCFCCDDDFGNSLAGRTGTAVLPARRVGLVTACVVSWNKSATSSYYRHTYRIHGDIGWDSVAIMFI